MLLREKQVVKGSRKRPRKCGPAVWRMTLGKWIQTRKVENFHKERVGSNFREDKALHET
jgi:hypothetical protein